MKFSPIAVQGQKRDAGVEGITLEGDTQFGGQRAPHTKRARGRGITSECYVTAVAEQIIGTVATRYASGGVSHKRKDESASRGNALTNGRSGGLWSMFLLWIPWAWSDLMFKIGQIFSI